MQKDRWGKEGYTIQEIALCLGLSRNTVSKAVRGKPGVSPKTQKQIDAFLRAERPAEKREGIRKNVVFTFHQENTEYTEYLNNILSGAESVLRDFGYTVILNIIRDTNDAHPNDFKDPDVAGVIAFNLFDDAFWHAVAAYHLPAVSIDAPAGNLLAGEWTDMVAVECVTPIRRMVDCFVDQGKTRFAFVGGCHFCYSTYQRWKTVESALKDRGLSLSDEHSIISERMNKHFRRTAEIYDVIRTQIKAMKSLPEVFFCSSDIQAIILQNVLKELGVHIPQDVQIVGFDNISETMRQDPPITTVDAHSEELGKTAAHVLLRRIRNPKCPRSMTYNQADIINRGSTCLPQL